MSDDIVQSGGWCAPANFVCACGAVMLDHTCEGYTVEWEAGPCETCGGTGVIGTLLSIEQGCFDCDGSGAHEAGSYTYDPAAPKVGVLDLPWLSITRGGIRFPKAAGPE